MGEILLVALIALILINVPLGICMGLASMLAIGLVGKVPVFLVVQRMFTGMDSFVMLAIPLFMIAGRLMELGGISRRLINLALSIVGSIHGGLGHATVLGCMFFAAISGSAPATVASIGTIMVPAMIGAGYDKRFAVALIASAGTIGVIIPPSIPFVTYGVSTSTSIGQLFMAGLLPGIIMGISLIAATYVYARKRDIKGDTKFTLNGFLKSLREAIWGLLMPGIILGGIYGGFFTPTEAAAVACAYSLFIGIVIYKELTFKRIITSFHEAGTMSAMVMLIVGAATAMGWILTAEQIPVKIAAAISVFVDSPWKLMLVFNAILLFMGCIMEPNAAIIILAPIFLPLLRQFDINLVYFGVVMVVNLALGLLTPPLGVNLFVANSLRKDVSFKDIVLWTCPLLGVMLMNLALFICFPEISLFLVKLLQL